MIHGSCAEIANPNERLHAILIEIQKLCSLSLEYLDWQFHSKRWPVLPSISTASSLNHREPGRTEGPLQKNHSFSGAFFSTLFTQTPFKPVPPALSE
jgi:hypothetical protein